MRIYILMKAYHGIQSPYELHCCRQ